MLVELAVQFGFADRKAMANVYQCDLNIAFVSVPRLGIRYAYVTILLGRYNVSISWSITSWTQWPHWNRKGVAAFSSTLTTDWTFKRVRTTSAIQHSPSEYAKVYVLHDSHSFSPRTRIAAADTARRGYFSDSELYISNAKSFKLESCLSSMTLTSTLLHYVYKECFISGVFSLPGSFSLSNSLPHITFKNSQHFSLIVLG